jgi:hypothetical protein
MFLCFRSGDIYEFQTIEGASYIGIVTVTNRTDVLAANVGSPKRTTSDHQVSQLFTQKLGKRMVCLAGHFLAGRFVPRKPK